MKSCFAFALLVCGVLGACAPHHVTVDNGSGEPLTVAASVTDEPDTPIKVGLFTGGERPQVEFYVIQASSVTHDVPSKLFDKPPDEAMMHLKVRPVRDEMGKMGVYWVHIPAPGPFRVRVTGTREALNFQRTTPDGSSVTDEEIYVERRAVKKAEPNQ